MKNTPSRLVVITLFGAAFLVYVVMLSITVPTLREFSGGLEIFDLSPLTFDRAEALALLDALGSKGRTYYLWRQIPLDLLYPALMGAALSTGIVATRAYAGWKHSVFRVLPFVPVIAAGLDYVENAHVITLLSLYPELPTLVCSSGMIVGILKNGFYLAGITAFIVCLVGAVAARLRRRSHDPF